MPHLAFYAGASDIASIVGFALEDARCVVYESYSVPDESLRTFTDRASVMGALRDGCQGMGFMLYAASMKGVPTIQRFALTPGAVPGRTWRERVSGWGLIQLEFGGVRKGKLIPSVTNHNSEKRARAWESTEPDLGPVAAWDFKEVARISRRINRYIVSHASGKHGGRLVLPGAQASLDVGQAAPGEA